MNKIETKILNCFAVKEAEKNMVFAARLTQRGHIEELPFFFLPIPSPPKNNVQRCTFVLSDILGSSKDTEQLKLGHFAACGM